MSPKKLRLQVTMTDVAKAAGVSTATISRTLSRPEKVSSKTRYRVEEAIIHTGYTPSINLALPIPKKTTLALLISSNDFNYSIELLEEFEHAIAKLEYATIIIDIKNSPAQLLTYLINTRQVNGLIIFDSVPPEFVQQQEAINILPKILINNFSPKLKITSINIDNLSSAYHATSYLYQCGHNRIACIAGPIHLSYCRDRSQGYLQALQRWGIAFEPFYLLETELSVEHGAKALCQLMQLKTPPTAIFCHNDFQAIGAIHQARQMDIQLPQQLSIIGFGNIKMAKYSYPALSSIGYSQHKLIETALSLLTEQIQQGSTFSGNRQIEYQLIIRDSTASPEETDQLCHI